jgi:hypothetical protein
VLTETPSIISEAVYAAMSPALRLASILITERNMLPVFDYIANGLVVGDAHGEMYIGKGSLEGTELGHEYAQQVFTHMASHSYIDFQFHPVWALPGRPPEETQYTTAFQMFQVALPLPGDSMDVTQSYSITTTTGEQMQRFVRISTSHINFRKCYLNYFEHTWRTDTPLDSFKRCSSALRS